MRRDLHGLVALEMIQQTFAIVALVAVAVYGIAKTHERTDAVAIALVVSLALAYLVHAFRIRMGQEHLRYDLQEMVVRRELTAEADGRSKLVVGRHPYRSDRLLQPNIDNHRHRVAAFRRTHLHLLLQMVFVALTITGAAIALRGFL